ncbi:MAG: hypothetical protein WCW33_03830 [Candidatus Babeliales bacterium]|jgi:hypothetical protein
MKKASIHNQTLSELLQWLKALGIATLVAACIFLIIWLIPSPYHTRGFATITDLQKYGSTIDEFIEMDNNNFLYPSYESYYQEHFGPSITRTLGDKLNWPLYTLHLRRPPFFSASFFKTLLEDVTNYRKIKGWQGDFIQKLEVKESSKLVVFGPVQGAYHGLVRYFEKLKELGIIDENLVVQRPDYYLIFLGNVVNRSPYTLEIFSILLELLKKNPENVVYLKGTNEYADYWKQHTLHRELELRCAHLSSSQVPLEHEVDEFFNTLPITLYCTIPFVDDKKLNYFKCAAFIEDDRLLSLIDAPRYATFLKQKSNERLPAFNLENGSDNDPEAGNVISRAIVRDIRKRDSYEDMDGLRLLPPTKGVPTWSVLSSTSETYRGALKFYYDAFVIITAAKELSNWKITLYNKNIRDKENREFKSKSRIFFEDTSSRE